MLRRKHMETGRDVPCIGQRGIGSLSNSLGPSVKNLFIDIVFPS